MVPESNLWRLSRIGFNTVGQTLLWNINNHLALNLLSAIYLTCLYCRCFMRRCRKKLFCRFCTRYFRRRSVSASPSPPTRPIHSSLETSPTESSCVLSFTQHTIRDHAHTRASRGAWGNSNFLLIVRRKGRRALPILKACLTNPKTP